MADALPGALAPLHRAVPVSRTPHPAGATPAPLAAGQACSAVARPAYLIGLRRYLRRLVLRQALVGRISWPLAIRVMNRAGGAQ